MGKPCNAMCQDFLDISNPKAVLEMTLRGFSCLTRGDCICLHYNNRKYYIDITEAKPQVGLMPHSCKHQHPQSSFVLSYECQCKCC